MDDEIEIDDSDDNSSRDNWVINLNYNNRYQKNNQKKGVLQVHIKIVILVVMKMI